MLGRYALAGLATFLSVFNALPVTACQIAPDETLGGESLVTEDVSVRGDIADLIEGGAARGRNLFQFL